MVHPLESSHHEAARLLDTFRDPGPDAIYHQKLGEGVFEIQRCGDCTRHFFYPRATCRYCGSANWAWRRPAATATVYSTTVVRRKAEEGGDYNVVIVELQEGPRMMSRIETVAAAAVRIGMPVEPRIDGVGAEAVLVFVPAGAEVRHG